MWEAPGSRADSARIGGQRGPWAEGTCQRRMNIRDMPTPYEHTAQVAPDHTFLCFLSEKNKTKKAQLTLQKLCFSHKGPPPLGLSHTLPEGDTLCDLNSTEGL